MWLPLTQKLLVLRGRLSHSALKRVFKRKCWLCKATVTISKFMAVARGEGADQAATRRCRLSEAPPEIPPPAACRLHTPPPALRSAVVLILLVSGISPSAPNTSPASVARSAATGLGGPETWRRCIRLQGGRGSWERGVAADEKWQGSGQVRPPMLTARTWNVCVSPGTKLRGEAKDVLSATVLSAVAAAPMDDARRSRMVCVPPE